MTYFENDIMKISLSNTATEEDFYKACKNLPEEFLKGVERYLQDKKAKEFLKGVERYLQDKKAKK